MRAYFFDLDDTLTDRYADQLRPKVVKWLAEVKPQMVAICTNQGGVGLRFWMESGDFGEPERYPTEGDVLDRLVAIRGQILAITNGLVRSYVCFAYLSKNGNWGPVPDNRLFDPSWMSFWRKPSPGMLMQAAVDFGLEPRDCIYVGNDDKDWEAAVRTGMLYMDERGFFEEVGR